MTDLKINARRDNEILWVNLNETEASIQISSNLAKKFEEYLAEPVAWVVVDMSAVDFIDSSFLGTLVATLKEAETRNKKFILFGLRSNVKAIFDLTRLDKLIDIYDGREALLKKIRGGFDSESQSSDYLKE